MRSRPDELGSRVDAKFHIEFNCQLASERAPRLNSAGRTRAVEATGGIEPNVMCRAPTQAVINLKRVQHSDQLRSQPRSHNFSAYLHLNVSAEGESQHRAIIGGSLIPQQQR